MMRILIIEFILSIIIGAVSFRLAWAFTSKHSVSWIVVLIIMAALYFFVPGSIDDFLIQYSGGSMASLHHFFIKMLRSAGLIVGVCLAAIVVIRREKKGLGKELPFKDFP